MLEALAVIGIGLGVVLAMCAFLFVILVYGEWFFCAGLVVMLAAMPAAIGTAILHGDPPSWVQWWVGAGAALLVFGIPAIGASD